MKISWDKLVDPITQSAEFWGDASLYPWQSKVMDEVWQGKKRVALVTPNEAGKTSVVVANMGLSFLAAYPGCQVVSTAGVWRQVEQQLWPVLRSKLAPYPDWKIVEGQVSAPSLRGIPSSTWVAFSADDPGKAEGYHGRRYTDENGDDCYGPLIFIVDEAKTVKDGIFDAMYRCDPDYVLIASTPGEDTGPFFDIVTNPTHRWVVYEVTWPDCPHLMIGRKREERQALIDDRGTNDPLIQSMIYGKFFRAGAHFVFDDMKDIEWCMSGFVAWERGERHAAIDFSGGGDEQVLMVRDGNRIIDMETWREKDTMKLAQMLRKGLQKNQIYEGYQVTADNGGLGQAIIDKLEEPIMGYSGMIRYEAAEEPRDKQKYYNRGSEDLFEGLRRLILNRAISLPNDPILREQMRIRRYEMPNAIGNKIRKEPKKKLRDRGEDSPDRLDTIEMLFADMPYHAAPKMKNVLDRTRTGANRTLSEAINEGRADTTPFGGMRCER